LVAECVLVAVFEGGEVDDAVARDAVDEGEFALRQALLEVSPTVLRSELPPFWPEASLIEKMTSVPAAMLAVHEKAAGP